LRCFSAQWQETPETSSAGLLCGCKEAGRAGDQSDFVRELFTQGTMEHSAPIAEHPRKPLSYMRGMNLHHAAAVLLLGWYLMVPPLTQQKPDSYGLPPDTTAPLSKWVYEPMRDHFDTDPDCKAELALRQESQRGPNRDHTRLLARILPPKATHLIEEQNKLARCVPDSDG
jgi:hypothetical protein